MDVLDGNQPGSILDVLRIQIDVFLSMIARPAVRWQIVVFFVILFIAWLLPEGIRRWRQKGVLPGVAAELADMSRIQRWLIWLYQLLTPILVLVFLASAIWLFYQLGYPNGILENLTSLVLLWFIYRVVLTLLYARYGESVRPYQVRIVTPIFLFVVILLGIESLPGSIAYIDAAISLGAVSFTLGSLLFALLILYVVIVVSWVTKQAMLEILPGRLDAEPGVIESVAILTRYTLLAFGIVFALGMLGLDFTSLAIVAGGLSVGVGIGLQDIVSNFVSGLMLLFEQSLRPGDVIEVDGRISLVEKISLRATTLRTRTNETLIIPNATFTTQQVKNFTKSDRLVQLRIPVGVSYKSDPEFVRELATETSLQHPLVLAAPSPQLVFMGYGESSLDFNLVVSVNRPEMTVQIRSDIYYMLWKVFEENGVIIPFPQRDLNLGDGWKKFTADLHTP